MSKRKSHPAIAPWLSARPDEREKRFIQVGNSLLLSKAFQSLGAGSRYLYFCMAMESGGRRHFLFPQAAAKKYGIASTSLRAHIRELAEQGFLTVHSMKNLRRPNEYAFSLEWKTPVPPPAGVPPVAISSRSDPK